MIDADDDDDNNNNNNNDYDDDYLIIEPHSFLLQSPNYLLVGLADTLCFVVLDHRLV